MSYTTIEIYCGSEEYHPGTVCAVRAFARTGPGEWTPLRWLDPDAEKLWWPDGAHVPLDEATGTDLRQDFRIPFTVRDKFRFPCYQCHRAGRYRRSQRVLRRGKYTYVKEAPLAVRAERLSEILELHHRDTGEPTLNLADLAVRVRSSAEQ